MALLMEPDVVTVLLYLVPLSQCIGKVMYELELVIDATCSVA